MVKIVVDVMLKPEIHDPQGEAIAGACHRLGFGDVLSVRQGKRFELELSDAPAAASAAGAASAGAAASAGGAASADRATSADAASARVAQLAAELLANPVIEEFTIRSA